MRLDNESDTEEIPLTSQTYPFKMSLTSDGDRIVVFGRRTILQVSVATFTIVAQTALPCDLTELGCDHGQPPQVLALCSGRWMLVDVDSATPIALGADTMTAMGHHSCAAAGAVLLTGAQGAGAQGALLQSVLVTTQ
jgi:hypothetical protein